MDTNILILTRLDTENGMLHVAASTMNTKSILIPHVGTEVALHTWIGFIMNVLFICGVDETGRYSNQSDYSFSPRG